MQTMLFHENITRKRFTALKLLLQNATHETSDNT
jgi:hypothetical protein